MKRLLAAALLALFLVGCRAPAPSMNLLAPYGSPTVPPPQTGAVGTSGDYYAPPTPPPAGTGAPATNLSTPGAFNPAGGYGAPPQTGTAPGAFESSGVPTPAFSGVVPASYSSATTASADFSQSETSSASSTLKLNGMRVNDATSVTQPQALPAGEPTNLTALPDASQSPSLLRVLNPSSSPAYATPTAASPTAASPTSAASSGGWQKR